MRNWIYETNPFLNASETSYPNALKLSTFHDSALATHQTDPFILGLYNGFHPLHMSLKDAYDGWIAKGGIQQGEGLNLNQLLYMLSHTKIQAWDVKIQSVYPQNTPEYKKLMPGRRGPFQAGTQDQRIHAVKALPVAIGSDTALATLKTEIIGFIILLDDAFNNQKQSLSSTKKEGITLETARVAMCINQYANLGALMQKYAATPSSIETYFDLKILRHMQQVFFTGQLRAGELYTIVKHTFNESDQIYLNNKGVAPLEFYLSPAKGERPTGTTYKLAHGEQTIPVQSLGKITDTFVMVYNSDPHLSAEYELEIL